MREFSLQTVDVDYLQFVERKAVGNRETKQEGTTLSEVADKAGQFTVGCP